MNIVDFEWDPEKERINRIKHKVDFFLAQYVFLDKDRVIARDLKHSEA
jgi:uncharacterized DUF497 family protein